MLAAVLSTHETISIHVNIITNSDRLRITAFDVNLYFVLLLRYLKGKKRLYSKYIFFALVFISRCLAW